MSEGFDCTRCVHRSVCPAYMATQTECRDYLPGEDMARVVRCGECRFSTAPKCQKEYCQEHGVVKCMKGGGIAYNRRVYKEDYCSYGQRWEE